VQALLYGQSTDCGKKGVLGSAKSTQLVRCQAEREDMRRAGYIKRGAIAEVKRVARRGGEEEKKILMATIGPCATGGE